MQRSVLLLTVLFLILVGGTASAQTDVSVDLTAAIANKVNGNGLNETATKSIGGLVSFRHFSGHHSGFEVNYGYTKNSQKYTDQAGNSVAVVQAGNHELTGAYVFRATRGSFQPFALAGGGALVFNPTQSALDTADPSVSRQKRPVFLYGVGADIRVSEGLAVRAQYRGLIYEAPDFFGARVAVHTSTAMQTAEPSIGIVYRF
jgi:opacity protein-like surface antigen